MHTSYVHKIPHHHQVVNTDARIRERVHEGPHARRRRTVSARSSSNALKKVLDFSSINSLSLLTHSLTWMPSLAFFCPTRNHFVGIFKSWVCQFRATALPLLADVARQRHRQRSKKHCSAFGIFTDQFGCERQCRHHRLR